jgi:hypothetical protein
MIIGINAKSILVVGINYKSLFAIQKINLEVHMVGQNNNLVPAVKFHQNT